MVLCAGVLSAAILDVARVEPPPQDCPLWAHPKVRLTPHISSNTNRPSAVKLIAENYHRHMRGEAMVPVVNTSAGY